MLRRVEHLTDKQLEAIVEQANAQWLQRPVKLDLDPERLTPLMACHIIRAYLKIIQADTPAGRLADETEIWAEDWELFEDGDAAAGD